jgi:hypothetical protein
MEKRRGLGGPMTWQPRRSFHEKKALFQSQIMKLGKEVLIIWNSGNQETEETGRLAAAIAIVRNFTTETRRHRDQSFGGLGKGFLRASVSLW